MVDGYRMSYVTGGQGAPVVLLHGIGSDCSIWRHTLLALAPHFRVYAPDLLGCGASEKPAITYSIETLTRSVAAFTEAIGIERAHVIGHSLGGGIALYFHQLYPERVERLALVASGGLGRELHWILRINALPGARSVLRVISDPRSPMPSITSALRRRHMKELHAAHDVHRPTILHRLRDPLARAAFVEMARSVTDLHGQKASALPHLPHIAAPVLVIWGAHDGILPLAHGRRAVKLLQQGHLHVLSASAHRPQVEEPEQFNRILLDFLSAEVWPPDAEATEGYQPAATRGRRGAATRHVRRVSSRRVVVALVAVGLVAGARAGLRYAPRSWH
jgi:pimeloyl-ACP methyl ester carboxylesterase